MKGFAILTVPRSGSNWLGSLANCTQVAGKSDEWLDPAKHDFQPATFEQLLSAVMAKGQTSNERFAVKIFPHHLHRVHSEYGKDFISECRTRYGIRPILLQRKDRLRQAISLSRGRMTGKWKSTKKMRGDEIYSFANICQLLFYIESSYAFWNAYLSANDWEYDSFFYEDLLTDTRPFFHAVMRCLDLPGAEFDVKTDLLIQRDAITEEWIKRFKADSAEHGILGQLQDRPAARTVENLLRLFSKKSLKGAVHFFPRY